MRILFLAITFTTLTSSLFASGVTIKLSGNQDPSCTVGIICVTDQSFDILTDSSGGGYFSAINAQGAPITELNFNLEYVDPGCPTGITTTPNLSFDTAFLQFAANSLEISSNPVCDSTQTGVADYALQIDFLPGIPDSFLFEINLNTNGGTDPGGAGGWVPNQEVTVYTATPEPGTLAAGAMGLALLGFGAYRRLRRGAV